MMLGLPKLVIAQDGVVTDSASITLVELRADSEVMTKLECEQYANYFANQLRGYMSPIIPYQDRDRRLFLRGRYKMDANIKDSLSTPPGQMPSYWCRILVTAQQMSISFDDFNNGIRVNEVFIDRKGRNVAEDIERLADATIDAFRSSFYREAVNLDRMNRVRVRKPASIGLSIPRITNDVSAYGANYYLSVNNKEKEVLIGPMKKIPNGTFLQLRIIEHNNRFELAPIRHNWGVSTGVTFSNDVNTGYVGRLSYQYMIKPKLYASAAWLVFGFTNDVAVEAPDGELAAPVSLREYEYMFGLSIKYQHYHSSVELISQLELGGLPEASGVFLRASIASAKLPALGFHAEYYTLNTELTQRTFAPLQQTAIQNEVNERLGFFSLGISFQFQL